MAPLPIQQIHDEIIAHIKKEGSHCHDWYVGIATDVEQRLFGDHKVPRKNAWYIFREAESEAAARAVEQFIIEKYGTQGGPGGGDKPKWVYAYKITDDTVQ